MMSKGKKMVFLSADLRCLHFGASCSSCLGFSAEMKCVAVATPSSDLLKKFLRERNA